MTRPPVRLYCDEPCLVPNSTVVLARESAHYLVQVMRSRPGDVVEVFNGRDGAFLAELVQTGKARVELRIGQLSLAQETPDDIWLCAAPLKKGRIDWLAEKACELGVARLQPVLTRRTVVDRLNLERLGAHMREAAEQCGRTSIPDLGAPVTLPKLLADWPADRALVFCDETGGAGLAKTARALAGQPLAVLIGPEGGFDAAERDMIRAVPGVHPVTLGPRVLRADTAAVAALAVIQAMRGG